MSNKGSQRFVPASDPVIEHKHRQPRPIPERPNTPISILEAKLSRSEGEAQKMLCLLAKAMVRCGYTRDGVYNSREAGWTGRRGRATEILWEGGKILLGRGWVRSDRTGKPERPYTRNKPASVQEMNAYELIQVASNLAPFLDTLENNVRHQVDALQNALKTIQGVLDRVESDPQPSDTPGQHERETPVQDDAE